MSATVLRGLIFAGLGMLLSACSTFNAEWKSAGQPGSKASRWDGRWTSRHHVAPGGSPMGGRLRGVFEPAENGAITAYFRANWLLFTSDYAMTLQPKAGPVNPRSAIQKFTGAHDLKAFGGLYRYEGTLDHDHFHATYDSTYDRGEFALQRIPRAQ